MAWIDTDHVNATFAFHNFAMFTNFANASAYLHRNQPANSTKIVETEEYKAQNML